MDSTECSCCGVELALGTESCSNCGLALQQGNELFIAVAIGGGLVLAIGAVMFLLVS